MAYKKGKEFEKETAELVGSYGRRIPRSGAIGTTEKISNLCGDAIWKLPWLSRPIIFECKHGYSSPSGKGKSMTIKREWFDKHLEDSKSGFFPAFAMKFKFTTENGISKFILIPFKTMKVLFKEMEDLYLENIELKSEVEKLKNEQKKSRT